MANQAPGSSTSYPEGSISGKVLDTDGLPVPDAIVTLSQDGSPVINNYTIHENPQASAPYSDQSISDYGSQKLTPDEGSFAFGSIYPGNYTLTAEIDGYKDSVTVLLVSNTDAIIVNITLIGYSVPALTPAQMSETGAIAGKTTDLQGIISGVTNVTLWQNGSVVRIPKNPQYSYQNGTYLFEHLAPGEYMLTAEVQGHSSFPVTVEVGNSTVTANLMVQGYIEMIPPSPTPGPTLTPEQLTYKGAITGFVFDNNGGRITNAMVRLWENGQEVQIPDNPQKTNPGLKSTNRDDFLFEHLAPGTYQITADIGMVPSPSIIVTVGNSTAIANITITDSMALSIATNLSATSESVTPSPTPLPGIIIGLLSIAIAAAYVLKSRKYLNKK